MKVVEVLHGQSVANWQQEQDRIRELEFQAQRETYEAVLRVLTAVANGTDDNLLGEDTPVNQLRGVSQDVRSSGPHNS